MHLSAPNSTEDRLNSCRDRKEPEGGALSAILEYLIRSKGSELGIPTGSRG
jgi:hypothetical protein